MGCDGICCGYGVATAHPTKMLVSLYNVTILQSMHCNDTRRCGVINYWFISDSIPYLEKFDLLKLFCQLQDVRLIFCVLFHEYDKNIPEQKWH